MKYIYISQIYFTSFCKFFPDALTCYFVLLLSSKFSHN